MKSNFSKKGIMYITGGAALAAIVALSCGKVTDSVVSPAQTELDNFSVALGSVDKYEAGPAYQLTSIAVDESMSDSSKTVYRITSNLTKWHTLTGTFSDSCSGEVSFTWDTSATTAAWIATIDHSKLSGTKAACSLTIDAGMGDTVPWSWVSGLLTTGVDTGAKTAAGAAILTNNCTTSCHARASTSTASGGYNMANTTSGSNTTLSYDALIGEKEHTGSNAFSDGAISYLDANLTIFKDFAVPTTPNVTCGAGQTAPSNATAASVKRIVKGDPAASLIVQITNTTWNDDGTDVHAVNTSNGLSYKYCSTQVKYRYMPTGKTAPINGQATGSVWTSDIHTKFARWVLQGAKNE
jgi:hypothetical protein